MKTANKWSGVFNVNDDSEVLGVDAETRDECERLMRARVREWRAANPGGTVEDAWMNTEASREIDRDYLPEGIITRKKLQSFRAEIAVMVQALRSSDPVPEYSDIERMLVLTEGALNAVGGQA